jgi:hypothetical protein
MNVRTKKKRNLSDETIRRMEAVIAAVLAQPELYNQRELPSPKDDPYKVPCCAVGWVLWVDNPERYRQRLSRICSGYQEWNGETYYPLVKVAHRILGLKDTEHRLFGSPSDWPWQYAQRYIHAQSDRGRAAAMAARWKHFIKTDGVD